MKSPTLLEVAGTYKRVTLRRRSAFEISFLSPVSRNYIEQAASLPDPSIEKKSRAAPVLGPP